MEEHCRKKKPHMKQRSPLQNLNGLPFHKRITKNTSNLSSSAFSVDHLKISSNSSSSSSNSRFSLYKNPKTSSKLAKSEPNKSKALSRSKENWVSRKPILQNSDKNQSQCLTRRDYGKNCRKPIYVNGRNSKLSVSKKGPQEFQPKMKNSRQIGSGKRVLELNGASNSSNSDHSDNCTPVGRLDSLRFRGSIDEGDNVNCGSDSLTPPVEASLSPEINCHSHSKMLVLKSETTPVCYGAGHLISGVADKRKCRRRGSLRGGPEKIELFVNENVANDSIPILAEGSVRWHLSPCKEGREDPEVDCMNRLNQCRMVYDLDKRSYSGSDSVANKWRNGEDAEVEGLLEPSSCNVVESLLIGYSGDGISSMEEKRFSESNSKLSIGSLSSGNVIQTPDSDIGSRLDVHGSKFVWPELGSTTESLERVKLSCRNEVSMWDGTDLGSQFQKNVDSVASWVSDSSTLGNLSLSQMRISWRDGTLRSTSVENDELDCCCVLSDDDIGERETYKGGTELAEIKENESKLGNDVSPVILDYEPCISTRVKKERDRTAESICTDGGGLVASDDSDWTYFHQDGIK